MGAHRRSRWWQRRRERIFAGHELHGMLWWSEQLSRRSQLPGILEFPLYWRRSSGPDSAARHEVHFLMSSDCVLAIRELEICVKVANSSRFESHQANTGRISGNGMVRRYNLAQRARRSIQWTITFHRNDSVWFAYFNGVCK